MYKDYASLANVTVNATLTSAFNNETMMNITATMMNISTTTTATLQTTTKSHSVGKTPAEEYYT